MKCCFKIIVFCLLLGSFCSQALAIIPDRTYRLYPEKLGLIYKDLHVTTPDGLKIKTWFFPAQNKPSETTGANPVKKTYRIIDNKKRPTIIICNGDAGNMSYQQLIFVQAFTCKGYNVVTFDWRGFGESSEWPMNTDYLAYTELLTDYDAVIKQVLHQNEVDTSKLAVFGWSTGAYLSMAASAKYENIKCFIGIGLMTSFDEVLPILNNLPKNKNINRKLIAPADYPKKLQPIYLAPTYKKSTLLIVGELDDRAPAWMSEKIYKALLGKKELWIVKGAGHSIGNESPGNWDMLSNKVVGFLDEHVK